MIAAGVLLGVMLSHAVLGQVWPGAYDQLFIGSGEAGERLAQRREQVEDELEVMRDAGVTQVAVQERERELMRELAVLEAQVWEAQAEHRAWLGGRMSALVVVLLGVMVIEGLVGSRVQGERASAIMRRLVTARYALVAMWLALAVAHPSLLRELAWGLVLGLSTLLAVVVVLWSFLEPHRTVIKVSRSR